MEIEIPVFFDPSIAKTESQWFAENIANPPVALVTAPPQSSAATRSFLSNPQLSLSTWEAALRKIWNLQNATIMAPETLCQILKWMKPKSMDDAIRKLSILETTFAERKFRQETVDEVKRVFLYHTSIRRIRLGCLADKYDADLFLKAFKHRYGDMKYFQKVFPFTGPALLYMVVSLVSVSQEPSKEFPNDLHRLHLNTLALLRETEVPLYFSYPLVHHLAALSPEQAQKTDLAISLFDEINPTLFFEDSPHLWYSHELRKHYPLLWTRLQEKHKELARQANVENVMQLLLSPLCSEKHLRASHLPLWMLICSGLVSWTWTGWDWWKRFDGPFGAVVSEMAQSLPETTRVCDLFDIVEHGLEVK